MTHLTRDEITAFEARAKEIEGDVCQAMMLPPLERAIPEGMCAISINLSDGRRLTRVKMVSFDGTIRYKDFLNAKALLPKKEADDKQG